MFGERRLRSWDLNQAPLLCLSMSAKVCLKHRSFLRVEIASELSPVGADVASMPWSMLAGGEVGALFPFSILTSLALAVMMVFDGLLTRKASLGKNVL